MRPGLKTRVGVCVKDVNQSVFVKVFADTLKKQGKLQVPEIVDIVKTGRHKELPPVDDDWFYLRCAAIARRLYFQSCGVGKFSHVFGGKRRYGTRPSHFRLASRGVIRKALKVLQDIKIVEQNPDEDKGGRRLTSAGRRILDRIAYQIYTRQITV